MLLSRLSRAEDVEVSDVSLCPMESDALQTDIFLSLLVSRCSECSFGQVLGVFRSSLEADR